jgi:hypothetical protein
MGQITFCSFQLTFLGWGIQGVSINEKPGVSSITVIINKLLKRILVKTFTQFDGVTMTDSGLTRFKNDADVNIIKNRKVYG